MIISACWLFLIFKHYLLWSANKSKSLSELIYNHNHQSQNDARWTLSKQSTYMNVLFGLFVLCTIEEQFHETFLSNTLLITIIWTSPTFFCTRFIHLFGHLLRKICALLFHFIQINPFSELFIFSDVCIVTLCKAIISD